MTAVGYAAPRNPRGQQKKGFDPVCFRWDDSAAVTATALAAYAAEHADALKKPRLPARIQRFLDEPPPRSETEAEDFPEVTDGKGSKLFPDGTVYTGEFKDGLRDGHGRYRSSLGAVYEGEWKEGERSGKGMERYPIGNVYEGQFAFDKREGLGTMWYPGGDTYEGFYRAGKKDGRGKYRSASGALYEGEYKADLRDGQGKERYPDGSVYEGGFKAGKRAGLGTMRYASGDVYVGPWKRDLRDGKGTFQYAGGARYEGEYKSGVMDGRGTYRFADGSVYVGEYKGGKREGRGVYRFSDGAVYEGEYKAGAMEGFGTYQYVDGRAEVGRYAGNVDVGEGVRWSADRTTAWRLNDGKVVEEISLETADRIARKIGKTRMETAGSGGSGQGQSSHRPPGSRQTSGRPLDSRQSSSHHHGSSHHSTHSRPPTSTSSSNTNGLSSFAPPNGGSGPVAGVAPTRSSRNSHGSGRPPTANGTLHVPSRPPTGQSRQPSASSHSSSTSGFKPSHGFGAQRNPHSVVHGSRASTPGSRQPSASGPGARNPLGGSGYGSRPSNPLGVGQRRAASAGQIRPGSVGLAAAARPCAFALYPSLSLRTQLLSSHTACMDSKAHTHTPSLLPLQCRNSARRIRSTRTRTRRTRGSWAPRVERAAPPKGGCPRTTALDRTNPLARRARGPTTSRGRARARLSDRNGRLNSFLLNVECGGEWSVLFL